jgi:hypothetical protein
MTSNTIYHYVYRITNLVEKKHYYGKRSSKCDPKQDLGKKYFSSSTDKEFRADQKQNPQNYRYKIVQIFGNAKLALVRESKLHYKFNVCVNERFYNKANQNLRGFDRTGSSSSIETRTKISKASLGVPKSNETKEKMSKAAIGRIRSDKTKARCSDAAMKHYFRGYYKTPLGIFRFRCELTRLKMYPKWCLNPGHVIHKQQYVKSAYLSGNYSWEFLNGKTFKDIGFSFEPK